ncbi:MAG: hypothetical protein R3F11_12235 [Verrucomicrobiales bacterium]
MFIHERDPAFLIKEGFLEKVEDFEHNGAHVPGSRLGYRMTNEFAIAFFGRVFSAPDTVFTEDMLRPELQSMDEFADGILNIAETHQRIIALLRGRRHRPRLPAAPRPAPHHGARRLRGQRRRPPGDPRALHRRLPHGVHAGKAERLDAKATVEQRLWKRRVDCLNAYLIGKSTTVRSTDRLGLPDRLNRAEERLEFVGSASSATGSKG